LTEERLAKLEAAIRGGTFAPVLQEMVRELCAEVRRLRRQLSPVAIVDEAKFRAACSEPIPGVRDDTKDQKHAVPESFKENARTYSAPKVVPITEDVARGRVSDEQVEALIRDCGDFRKPAPRAGGVSPDPGREGQTARAETAELRAAVKGLFDRMGRLEPAHNTLADRVERLEQTRLADVESRLDVLEERAEEIPYERLGCFLRSLGGIAMPHAIFNEWKALMDLIK
jgi:hypothetical protein